MDSLPERIEAAEGPEPFNPEWDREQANAWYRRDVQRQFVAKMAELEPFYREANPDKPEAAMPYSCAHGAIMEIIDQLFSDEETGDCPFKCSSDIAWEVMYALGFNESDAAALRAKEQPNEG